MIRGFLWLLACLLPGAAWAGEERPECEPAPATAAERARLAERYESAGREHLANERPAEALRIYHCAFGLTGDPTFRLLGAVARLQLGDCEGARDAYRQGLAAAPDPAVQAWVAGQWSKVADCERPSVAPVATVEGPTPPAPTEESPPFRTAAWITAASALALGGATVWFAVERGDAQSEAQRLEEDPDQDAFDRAEADYHSAQRNAIVLGIGAGAAAVAAGTLFFLGRERDTAALPRLAFSADGASIVWTGSIP